MSESNPCIHKKVCKNNCELGLDIDDRPKMCKSMACRHYTPCVKCGINVDNIGTMTRMCPKCTNKTKGSGRLSELVSRQRDSSKGQAEKASQLGVNIPGKPPGYLDRGEAEFYKSRWEEYQGYYSNPAAKATCHFLILEELNYQKILATISNFSDIDLQLEEKKKVCLTNIKNLRGQLPDKEASSESDYEKTMSVIFHDYEEELRKRDMTLGGKKVSRIFSQEAIALAPQLVHQIDLEAMLRHAGYETKTVEEILEKVWTKEDLENLGLSVLEFFGFKLKEKYALDKSLPGERNEQPQVEE